MDLNTLSTYLDALFDLGMNDASLNGLQVGYKFQQINKIAFAVDASLASIEQAHKMGADMLIVHHGIYWGKEQPMVGTHYDRIKALVDYNIALYAAHLPLDAHPEFGNNVEIAKSIGLGITELPDSKQGRIHVIGHFDEAQSIDQILNKLGVDHPGDYRYLPFGPKDIKKVLICSGEGGFLLDEAIAEGCDLILTGELMHKFYHPALEAKINYLAAGHYATEAFGIRALLKQIAADERLRSELEFCFIEQPTGL